MNSEKLDIYINKEISNNNTKTNNNDNDNDSENDTKNIIIIGCGYAGALLSKELEKIINKHNNNKNNKINLIIINKTDSFWYKIGSIRGCVDKENWCEKAIIPIKNFIKSSRIIVGNVIKIDQANQLIKINMNNNNNFEEFIKYDVLVCTTGPSYHHSMCDLPNNVYNKQTIVNHIDKIYNKIKDNKKIVIIGGGPTGIELAGEIRRKYKDKEITIFSSTSSICSTAIAKLPKKFHKIIENTLKKNNIKLIKNQKVIKPSFENDFKNNNLLVTEVNEVICESTIDSNKNTYLKNDNYLCIYCGSWKDFNPISIYPDEWLNEIGEIEIDKYFKVKNGNNVFAFGDVADLLETKQAITLPKKVSYVSKNIYFTAINNIKKLKSYKITDKPVFYLPIGENEGASVSKFGIVYGGKKTSKLKGKDLFYSKFNKILEL